jgi:hypothetical protein
MQSSAGGLFALDVSRLVSRPRRAIFDAMPSIVPSYIAKLDRAQHHLDELKEAINAFGGSGTEAASRPYTITRSRESRRMVDRLEFTRSVVNTDIPLIAADAIYNLRSGLDHLMTALSPAGRNPIFPIFFRGVADPPVDGENDQRIKLRERWVSDTAHVAPHAVELLKRLQPPDEPTHAESPHGLRLLNQLSNKDRHTRLPLVADGVEGLIINWRMPDGHLQQALARPDADHLIEDGAKLSNVPQGAEYEACYGPVHIVIKTPLSNEHGAINLPVIDFVSDTLDFIRDTVVSGLVPNVRR